MRNGIRIQKVIRTTDMVSFLEKAGYTTKSVSQVLEELGISESSACWPLCLSLGDMSYKVSWNNDQDRNRVYNYLSLLRHLTKEETDKLRQSMLYLSTESRFNGLKRHGLTDIELSRFFSQNVAENLLLNRINEIIIEGDV